MNLNHVAHNANPLNGDEVRKFFAKENIHLDYYCLDMMMKKIRAIRELKYSERDNSWIRPLIKQGLVKPTGVNIAPYSDDSTLIPFHGELHIVSKVVVNNLTTLQNARVKVKDTARGILATRRKYEYGKVIRENFQSPHVYLREAFTIRLHEPIYIVQQSRHLNISIRPHWDKVAKLSNSGWLVAEVVSEFTDGDITYGELLAWDKVTIRNGTGSHSQLTHFPVLKWYASTSDHHTITASKSGAISGVRTKTSNAVLNTLSRSMAA